MAENNNNNNNSKTDFQRRIRRVGETFQEATQASEKRIKGSTEYARHKDVNVARSAEQFRRWDALKAQGARFRGSSEADKELTKIQTAIGAFDDGHFARMKDQAIKDEMSAQKRLEGSSKLANDAQMGIEIAGGILGDEGLGRLGDDEEVQAALQRYKDISDKGLSSAEFLAERERMQQGIDRSTQSGLRGIQARLARMGVKGAVAGQQLMQREFMGAAEKAQGERELFLKSAQLKREGLEKYSDRLGQVKTFDLAQEAKEIDILSQSAFGFMSLGSSERTAREVAQIQKDAQVQSAAASKPGGGTHLCTVMKDFGYLTNEIWEEDFREGQSIIENDYASYIGYSVWAYPLAKIARENKVVRSLLKPFICAWASHIFNKRRGLNKINLLGKAMELFGKPVCRFIGTLHLAFQKEKVPVRVGVGVSKLPKKTGQKK
jgi:hypothetical protein